MTTTTPAIFDPELFPRLFGEVAEIKGFEHACVWLTNKVMRRRMDPEDAARILTAYVENH